LLRALARFDIRFRWLIVGAWIVAVIAANRLLPSLSSVSQVSNGAFLPASAPSQKALDLAAPLQNPSAGATAVIVASRSTGSLTGDDSAAMTRVETAVGDVPGVVAVHDEGASPDGRAREALVMTSSPTLSNGGDPALVAAIRATFAKSQLPPGLELHLTGPLAQTTDGSASAAQAGRNIRLFSVLFVVVLLVVVYRSLLAPLVTLLPPLLSLLLAGPLIARAGQLGLPVSPATQTLLPVLLLGAGTDYGLFLVYRLREEIRRGAQPAAALENAMDGVGVAIAYSATTVVAALACLVLASFVLYRGLGPSLALGVLVLLAAALTLLPALLSITGRWLFWPSHPAAGQRTTAAWGRLAGRVVQRPLPVLIAGLVLLGALASGLTRFAPGGFTSSAPAGSDSAAGDAAIATHFPAGNSNPEILLLRFASPVSASSSAVIAARNELSRSPHLSAVSEPIISRDGRTVRFNGTSAAGRSGSQAAITAIPALRATVAAASHDAAATDSGVAGPDAVAYDLYSYSTIDLATVAPVILVLLALLLGLLLRSVVAPLYLLATVALSYLAALGAASLVFLRLAGDSGINFLIPVLLFAFAMALGEDYNMLLMTRVREEAHRRDTRPALVEAVAQTGGSITSAGLILAGTFAVLAVAGNSDQSRQLGFTIAFAVLVDTFFIRTLLVPSIAVVLGRWNWWPSQLTAAAERSSVAIQPANPGESPPLF
jgi:RND superfamily putative drug exporter